MLAGERTSDAELADVIASPAQRTILAESHDGLIGSVTVTDLGAGMAYLGMLAVMPDQQAAGIGRALISRAEEEVIATFAATAMEMTVISRRSDLIAWYRRRGYEPTGERRPFPADVPEAPELEMVVLARALD